MKIWRLAVVSALGATCGCLQVDPILELNRDGSGSLEVKYSITEQAVEQFRAMHRLRGQLGETHPEGAALSRAEEECIRAFLDPTQTEGELSKIASKHGFDGSKVLRLKSEGCMRVFLDPTDKGLRAILKKYEGNGLTVRKLKVDARNVSREVNAKLEFRDLAELARCDLFQLYGFNLRRGNDDDYLFERPAVREPLPSDEALAKDGHVKMLSEVLGGLRVTFKAQLPGRILTSNASQRGGHSAMWVFDFNDDPRTFAAMQTVALQATFERSGLDLPEVSCRVGQQ